MHAVAGMDWRVRWIWLKWPIKPCIGPRRLAHRAEC
jgi:hypothetical protein